MPTIHFKKGKDNPHWKGGVSSQPGYKSLKYKRWRINNKERARKIYQDYYQKTRNKVLIAYGNKCNCCGEKNIKFLTIDHINNDGAEHKKKIC